MRAILMQDLARKTLKEVISEKEWIGDGERERRGEEMEKMAKGGRRSGRVCIC